MAIKSTLTSAQSKKTPVTFKVFVILSLLITIGGTLTGIMTYMNVGFNNSFITSWLSSFALVVLIMLPIGIGLMTLITKLINALMPEKSKKFRDLIIGVFMAIVMESLMAFITTTNNIGLSNTLEFANKWLEGFVTALPIGLTIMLIMSLTIKPKVERLLKS